MFLSETGKIGIRESGWIAISLGFIAVVQSVLIMTGEGAYGGADNIGHFRIARYAFQYPELFFDHWGKPVFTLLFAPAAQLGFVATQLQNLLIGLVTLWLAADLLKIVSVARRWPVILLGALAPMNFMLLQSCLTEVLMGLFLVASIWLVFKKKPYAAAILLSFLPFVRTESVVVFPLFMVYFAFHRQFMPIILLATGSIVYSISGYFVYQDIGWIFNKMPYSLGDSLYGSGELLHFVKNLPLIVGIPFLLMLIAGIVDWSLKIQKSVFKPDPGFWLFWLVNGSWGLYFAAHSYVWWQGTGGSLGLIRVIAAVIPLMAVTAALGFHRMAELVKSPLLVSGFGVVVIAWQLLTPVRQHPLPFRWERPQQLMKEAAHFIHSAEPAKIHYFDPFLLHFLEMDPFNPSLSTWGAGDKITPSNGMDFGDLLVWDAHFGPNEGGISPEAVMQDPRLQLERTFIPVENIKVLGGYDYGIYIFRKVAGKTETQPLEVVERTLDFSKVEGNAVALRNGIPMLLMNASVEFSPAIQVSLSEIKADNYIEVLATVDYIPEDELNADAVLLIVSVEQGSRSISYNKTDLTTHSINEVCTAELVLRLAPEYPEGTVINLYVWNKDRKKLWLEKIQLSAQGF